MTLRVQSTSKSMGIGRGGEGDSGVGEDERGGGLGRHPATNPPEQSQVALLVHCMQDPDIKLSHL